MVALNTPVVKFKAAVGSTKAVKVQWVLASQRQRELVRFHQIDSELQITHSRTSSRGMRIPSLKNLFQVIK